MTTNSGNAAESFQPIANTAPRGLSGKVIVSLRHAVDFQFHTVAMAVNQYLIQSSGSILDVGCGDSPYRHMFPATCTYTGIDVASNSEFGYNRKDILLFLPDGTIPLNDNSVDGVLCTEVMEHVFDFSKFVQELYRVLKPGGTVLLTVPWSARYHYIPNDFFRYTPSGLEKIFSGFVKCSIAPRGTDITSICAKIVVALVRSSSISGSLRLFLLLRPFLWIAAVPIGAAAIILGHLSLKFSIGSKDDPLGYTISLEK